MADLLVSIRHFANKTSGSIPV